MQSDGISNRGITVREEEKIKVEKIHGKIVFVGAEDDVLWDTCKYIRRMEQFLDIHPGSVSVLGLMNDKEHRVKLAIDEDVLKEEMFGCHPCENTSSIRFKTRDLMEKILPALNITPTIVHLVGTE